MAMVYAGYDDDYGNPVMVDDGSGGGSMNAGYGGNNGNYTTGFDPYSGDQPYNPGTFTSGGAGTIGGGSDITSIINGVLGTNLSGAELAKRAAVLAGGAAGAAGLLAPNVQKVGYQGSIPKYTATRNMVTAPPTRAQGYRPGQGGINYGGDVTYTPAGGSSSGISGGSSSGGSSMLGDIAKIAGGAGAGALLANYLGNSGGTSGGNGAISNILKGITGSAKPGVTAGGVLEKMPNVTAGQPTPGQLERDDAAAVDALPWNNMPDYNDLPPEMPTYTEFPSDFDYTDWSFAKGGNVPRYLQGETDGMADKIPARIGQDQPAALSHGEFVVPADVVSHLGNGNSDAGAKKLYSMMDNIRKARTGTKKQGKKINPDKFMPGGLAQAYAGGGSVKHFVTGGTTLPAGSTGSEQAPASWAGEYVTDMMGKAQALASSPYQQYGGPLTAGESGLQSKVFGGLQSTNFPGNLGTSFSSTGAYQPPQLNMGAYQQKPIGIGNYNRPSFEQYTAGLPAGQQAPVTKEVYDAGLAGNQIYNAAQPPMMLNQGSNGFGDFGSMQAKEPLDFGAPGTADYIDRNNLSPYQSMARELQGQPSQNAPENLPGLNNLFNQNMQAMTGLKNQGPAQRQTYEDYISSPTQELKMPREQFEAQQDMIEKMRSQGMDMLRRGDMNEIMAGLGGKPGQMPQGGLAGLAGRMQQPQPAQPQQEAQNIAQQYMNPYLQSVLTPQMEELRRQAQINNMSGLGALTKSGAFGGGRQAIMESEAGRNLLAEQNKAIGQGYASAFDRAQQQFNTEQNQGMGLAKLMSDQGAQQRGIEAEGIAADKAAFEAARENPYKMLQYQQSFLQGMPISATNYTMPQQDWLTKAAGGATTVNTLLNTLGLGTPTGTAPAAPKK